MKKDETTGRKKGAYLIATPAISLPLMQPEEKKEWTKVVLMPKKKRIPLFSLCGSDSCIEDL